MWAEVFITFAGVYRLDDMGSNQINKYVWLVDTIHRAGHISLKEISRKWQKSELSDGAELPERTFHKWRIAIEELFGLIIDNERSGDYCYFIANDEELKNGGIKNWLLDTISVSNLIAGSRNLKDRILLEEIPSGRYYLPQILQAMNESRQMEIQYQSYWQDVSSRFVVEPYCLKLFHQRWYLVAYSPGLKKNMIYSLDRIQDLVLMEQNTYAMPEDFNAEAFFSYCFGAVVDDGTKVEHVKLKVSGNQQKYLRSLPLHQSQQEIQAENDYSIFEYHVKPTFDFRQAILSFTPDIEVLQPSWLRHEIAGRVEALDNRYKGINQ